MKALTVLLVLICAMGYAQEPEVDLVRLGYLKTKQLQNKWDGSLARWSLRCICIQRSGCKIYDIRAGRFIKRFTIPFADLFDMQLTNDGKLILAEGKQVIIMDWKGENLSSIQHHRRDNKIILF